MLGNQVQVGPELVRPNQVINPMRGLWIRGSEMRRNQVCLIVGGCEHMEHGGYSQTWTYSSQGGDC